MSVCLSHDTVCLSVCRLIQTSFRAISSPWPVLIHPGTKNFHHALNGGLRSKHRSLKKKFSPLGCRNNTYVNLDLGPCHSQVLQGSLCLFLRFHSLCTYLRNFMCLECLKTMFHIWLQRSALAHNMLACPP